MLGRTCEEILQGEEQEETSPLSLVLQYNCPFSKEPSCYVFVQWKFITLSSTRQPFRCAGVKKKKNYAETPSRYRPSVLVKTLRGFQFNDGDYVYKGDILVRQLGMEIYPGESVKLDPETWNLVALSNGRFTISTEKLSPFPDSPLYDKVKDGEVIYKPFVHVIGDPIEPLYKLKRIL
ncbi:unnamed protein product [Schistosoma bovis]|nr:unnamed protein product [Schistosoma bovis]